MCRNFKQVERRKIFYSIRASKNESGDATILLIFYTAGYVPLLLYKVKKQLSPEFNIQKDILQKKLETSAKMRGK